MANATPDGQTISTLHIRVGASFNKEYQWKTGTPPTPVDLTGWTAKAQFYASDKSNVVILELTTENGGITLTAQGGIILDIEFGTNGTQKFVGLKQAVFDLELTDPTGTYRRNLIGGPAIIYPERTK